MDNPDACPDCSPTCPVKQGENYKYSRIFPVKQEYPNVSIQSLLFVLFQKSLYKGYNAGNILDYDRYMDQPKR